tara:strand:- start:1192 stop:2226 length:1035 start_codon:yes stop_codon:yes gene_type:complete
VIVEGEFNDGRTSRTFAAYLTAEGDDLVVCDYDDAEVDVAEIDDVVVSSRLGRVPRTFTFPSGSLFTTEDNDGVDELLGPESPGLALDLLERHLGLIVVATLFTLGFSVWVVLDGIPRAAERIAMSLPGAIVEDISGGSLDVLDTVMFDDSELSGLEKRRVRDLVAPALALHPGAELHFRKGPPNAFALPDASIVFTDGIVELAEHDGELLAVAYHEVGHLHHRHLLRRVIQSSGVAVVVFLITGDVSSFDLLIGLPAVLVDLAYSRDFEREADVYALESMVAAGQDLEHFARIMRRLEGHYTGEGDEGDGLDSGVSRSVGKLQRYLATHPAAEDRAELIEAYR